VPEELLARLSDASARCIAIDRQGPTRGADISQAVVVAHDGVTLTAIVVMEKLAHQPISHAFIKFAIQQEMISSTDAVNSIQVAAPAPSRPGNVSRVPHLALSHKLMESQRGRRDIMQRTLQLAKATVHWCSCLRDSNLVAQSPARFRPGARKRP